MTATAPDQDAPPPDWGEAVVGAVLCGGRSTRFGSDKALAPFGSSTVGDRVVAALRGAGVDPVAAIGGTAGDRLGLPTIADRRPGEGPLAGLATALAWVRTGWVVVVPCDLPLLEPAHVAALLSLGPEPDRPIVATVDGRPKVSLAVWPASCGRVARRLLDNEERRFRAMLDEVAWRGVEVPPEAVADADTPDELDRLQAGGG
ncbi:MAG: molybdenum cofactor guanylyltransferase [Actinomycetota bacterium]